MALRRVWSDWSAPPPEMPACAGMTDRMCIAFAGVVRLPTVRSPPPAVMPGLTRHPLAQRFGCHCEGEAHGPWIKSRVTVLMGVCKPPNLFIAAFWVDPDHGTSRPPARLPFSPLSFKRTRSIERFAVRSLTNPLSAHPENRMQQAFCMDAGWRGFAHRRFCRFGRVSAVFRAFWSN
jgi:hypothetical protein